MRTVPAKPRRQALCAALLVVAVTGASADSTAVQLWPEVEVYRQLGDRSRLLVTTAAIGDTQGEGGGVASFTEAQFTINFDYTLAPPGRRDVPEAEWSKNRLLWGRIGIVYDTSGNSGDDAYRAKTVLLSPNWRYPLREDIWLRSRARADLRNINGEPSQRYRLQAGAEWEASAFDRPLAPYAEVEFYYDTRYDKWNRATLKTGAETQLGPHWRLEPYIALQLDKPRDETTRVLGLGLVLKYYFPAD